MHLQSINFHFLNIPLHLCLIFKLIIYNFASSHPPFYSQSKYEINKASLVSKTANTFLAIFPDISRHWRLQYKDCFTLTVHFQAQIRAPSSHGNDDKIFF